jgi:hypothetical protein
MPQFPPGISIPPSQYRAAGIRFASVTQSDGTRTMSEAPVFLPTGQIHVEFVPSKSTPTFAHEDEAV